MLIDLRQLKGIYLICGKTDLRRAIDGLAATITDQYELDPYSRALFLFAVPVKIVLRPYIGPVMAFSYFINESKMAACNGQPIKMR